RSQRSVRVVRAFLRGSALRGGRSGKAVEWGVAKGRLANKILNRRVREVPQRAQRDSSYGGKRWLWPGGVRRAGRLIAAKQTGRKNGSTWTHRVQGRTQCGA